MEAATLNLSVDPSRSMKAITSEVEELLDGLDESSRRASALMATELVAQVVSRAPASDGDPVGLTVHLREDVVRVEARGPLARPGARPGSNGAPVDPLADWGRFILDRLADRWGVGGDDRRELWAEIERPA